MANEYPRRRRLKHPKDCIDYVRSAINKEFPNGVLPGKWEWT